MTTCSTRMQSVYLSVMLRFSVKFNCDRNAIYTLVHRRPLCSKIPKYYNIVTMRQESVVEKSHIIDVNMRYDGATCGKKFNSVVE